MEVNPLAVILVYFDSKGDRLLYRYPYQTLGQTLKFEQRVAYISEDLASKKRNPFAITTTDDLLQTPTHISAAKSQGQLQGFADDVLSALFAVKPQLCNQKFELKLNDVRFVTHPTLIPHKEQRPNNTLNTTSTPPNTVNTTAGPSTSSASTAVGASGAGAPIINNGFKKQQMLINIVFALHAQASYSIVKCYHDLSKRLGLALKFEEQRSGYLTEETAQMARTHDEQQQQPLERTFELIAERSSLAQALKSIFHDLCTTGLLSTTFNQNLTLSFCLPQKAHQLHKKGSMVDPETIDRCLHALKPYHGMLLLVDFAELLDCVPPTGARMLLQLVEVYTPLMSLQSMASDADLSIDHVYKLVSHLVYWAKATIIYPLCETNVYVIAPDAPLHTKSHLVEKFSIRFAGMSLFEVISDFSLPTSIGHLTTPLQQPARQGILAQMVLWMLQHHLLMQLHTYVQFMPSDDDDDFADSASCAPLQSAATPGSALGSCGNLTEDDDDPLHDSSILSIPSQPLPVPHISRRDHSDDHYSMCGGSMTSDNIAVTASLSDSIDSMEDEQKIKELLQVFDANDRAAIRRIPASMNVDDLSLMVKLYQMGYFKSEHHLEEIMYFENLRRSQLLQLLDKFRNVLIIYETEDPAIASMYNAK